MIALNCDENRIVVLQTSREIASQTDTFLIATSSFKFQNYCDNESIFVIFAALICAHSALQFYSHNWKSYVIVDWDAKCEKVVQITKSWAKRFRRHFCLRFDTNLTEAWFFKSQNYYDNESISVIFATLNCAYSVLQFELNNWKSYVIFDWCASCETTVRTLAFRMSFDDWTKRIWWSIALKTWIKYWLNLSTLRNTDAELIRILFDRSLALSDFIEHFL